MAASEFDTSDGEGREVLPKSPAVIHPSLQPHSKGRHPKCLGWAVGSTTLLKPGEDQLPATLSTEKTYMRITSQFVSICVNKMCQ